MTPHVSYILSYRGESDYRIGSKRVHYRYHWTDSDIAAYNGTPTEALAHYIGSAYIVSDGIDLITLDELRAFRAYLRSKHLEYVQHASSRVSDLDLSDPVNCDIFDIYMNQSGDQCPIVYRGYYDTTTRSWVRLPYEP